MTTDAPTKATVFHAARIVTGDGETVFENGYLIVRDGLIEELGSGAGPQQQEDILRVSLEGKSIIPTIINVHGHIGYMKNGVTSRDNFSRENVLDHLKRLSYYGVSVFQSLGTDRDGVELDVREELRAGLGDERGLPLLLTAGRGLVAPTEGSVNGGPFFATDVVLETDEPQTARRMVAQMAKRAPDAIKFWVDDRNGTKAKLSPETYAAIVEEAHAHGVKAIAHIHDRRDAKGVARAHVDAIAHLVRDAPPDDELIHLMKTRRVVAFSSMSIQRGPIFGLEWLDDLALSETVTEAAIDALRDELESFADGHPAFSREVYGALEECLRVFMESGVEVLLSADTGLLGQVPGFAEHRELEAIVRAGVSPHRAIRAATVAPAEFLGLHDRGALEAGNRADFLVLDADPLVDIRNSLKISDVYLRGARVDREGLRRELLAVR